MVNRDLENAWIYHNSTKHSYQSVHQSAYFLDWPNRPQPFKIYSTLNPIPLPDKHLSLEINVLDAISTTTPVAAERIPGLSDIANILFFSAGITKQKRFPVGEIFFRA